MEFYKLILITKIYQYNHLSDFTVTLDALYRIVSPYSIDIVFICQIRSR